MIFQLQLVHLLTVAGVRILDCLRHPRSSFNMFAKMFAASAEGSTATTPTQDQQKWHCGSV